MDQIDDVNADDIDAFKRSLLSDLVNEDYQGVWEPLWALNASMPFNELSDSVKQQIAENVLRDLYADELIYFFNAGSKDPNAAGDDEAARLSANSVEQTLKGNGWRTLPPTDDTIWIGPTPKGVSAITN